LVGLERPRTLRLRAVTDLLERRLSRFDAARTGARAMPAGSQDRRKAVEPLYSMPSRRGGW
jgi:hypothetical protein